ncbi:hypothetical protein GQX73_g7346 [Xylaria multiplex]|uniref:Ubiquitin-like domain-containing protein n=1 Tax=Xylaria multiplex TaxID=323545 RepID=A0A7C8IKX3_9PEZI|nr:hypothetical protein GQX73_g7346 [Xylaria multiplex]
MASRDRFAPETEQMGSYRQARPPVQPWYPPAYYYPYPGVAPYPANNVAPYPQLATQNTPARWGIFDPFDEEEQERRKKGKELVPLRPILNGPPPPWSTYPGGYGPGAYGPLENPMWPALPPSQPAPLPLAGLDYLPRRPGKHVRHLGQFPGTSLNHDFRASRSEDKIIQDVDGILTPNSGDLTVHLTMDLEEDLEDRLDEMNRLSRLGDFKSVTLLKDNAMYKREGEHSDSEELRALRVNWELLRILAKSYSLDALSGAPDAFEEAVNILRDCPRDRPISSTEIEIFALTLQLTSRPALDEKWSRYGFRALDAFCSHKVLRLYQTLLRQGRIWDFHDIIVLLPTMEDIKALTQNIFGKDLIPSLGVLISDWSDSVHGYDASTALGLLSIMTHIMLKPVEASEKECIDILKLCLPLAISVAENDPGSLKSRPYLRLLLAKSRFAETASRQAIDTLTTRLQSAQGIFYHSDIASLPIYVPSEDEVPQWTPTDQPPELKDPVKLVLRSAIELGDLETEVLARQELIRLSGNPREEIGMLCNLQLFRQGDLNSYGLTLASKYLVSNTKAAKEELAILISRLLSKVASTDYWNPSHEWILNMLLYKLEARSPLAIKHMLERSNTDYQSIEEPFLREISRKMPVLKDWVDQQAGNSTQAKAKDSILRASSRPRRTPHPTATRTRVRREKERPSRGAQNYTTDRRREGSDILLTRSSKPRENRQDQRPQPEDAPSRTHSVNNEERATIFKPRDNQETPLIAVSRPDGDSQNPRDSLHTSKPVVTDLPVNTGRQDDAALAAQIRHKLEAEFDKRLEAEKDSERERRMERMAILEGLKREVEAIRREAVEQAEKKARVEARERAEQLRWERRIEESNLEKEKAMAKAEAAAAELDAKFEAAREVAIRDAERKMKEEFEIRKMKEDEARQQAEREIRKRIEAEKRAREEAEASEKLREELQRKAEAEIREKKKAEEKAFEAAMKQVEEEGYRETIRQWAAERAEKDLETQNQIHFKDAVGRKYAIPFSQGRTWEGMKELIETAFLHVDVIGPEVLEGHYDLAGPDGTIILPQTWEEIIKPGWNITMTMWPIAAPPNQGLPPELRRPILGLNIPASGPLPPAPPDQSTNEEAVIDEPEEQERISEEQTRDDVSSGFSQTPASVLCYRFIIRVI